jgi:hypothetical protein
MANGTGFLCSCCGQWHEGLPLDRLFDAPAPSILHAAEEHGVEVESSPDWYVIGHETCLIRGLLPIPVIDGPEEFRWGVWFSLSATNFLRVLETWESGAPAEEPMYFSYLCNTLPDYPDTLFLEGSVDARSATQRPRFYLHDADHPLVRDQREGITMAEVHAMYERYLHPRGSS